MVKRDKYEAISELAKRRGFFWPSYEIYGGVSGFLTYGNLGTILKRRIEEKFRNFFLKPLEMLEIECSVITPGKVFEASGHVRAFREPMVECSKCKRKFRADHLLQNYANMSDTETEKLNLNDYTKIIKKRAFNCPECGGQFTDPEFFMTMFTTTIGPYSDAVGYGRPEAAQGVFVEFKRLFETARGRLPLGIAQIGHALRNEISPRQGLIRLREFTIADIEFFYDPEESKCPLLKEVEKEKLHLIPASRKRKGLKKAITCIVNEALEKEHIKTEWQAYFMVLAKQFLNKLGVPNDKQRFIEKLEWERAHYSLQGYDQEIYLDRWGWIEVSGHNCRTDYDLKQHMLHSKVDMKVFKQDGKSKFKIHTIIEPILSKMGPVFKKDANRVLDLLSKVTGEEVESAFKKEGNFKLQSFKILPEYVNILHKKIEESGRRFIPNVVEPSFGIDRLVYVTLEFAYNRRDNRTLLEVPRDLAPIQVGIFPLVTKDELTEKAKQLHSMLLSRQITAEYDETGSIGRRYARADEIGTPLCITVDYQTKKDNTVTIRDRDSWKQIRIEITQLPKIVKQYLHYEITFEEMGINL